MIRFEFENIHTTESYIICIDENDYSCKSFNYLLDCARMKCIDMIMKDNPNFDCNYFYGEFYLKSANKMNICQ